MIYCRLVPLQSGGWVYFDVTAAVEDWSRDAARSLGLEVWIENARSGLRAVRWARKTRFIKPRSSQTRRIPELVISFLDDYQSNLNNIG